ncbi:MAG TPA: NAD(P)H-dependent oxidoreductase [Opitutaceae bacterium]|nr:NAD(P)H-dependent oxidoreductase [Opitutaceae bacterium]
MKKRIAILQGNPDASTRHLGHALADAYAEGALAAGHAVERVEIAQLEFPLLRTAVDWNTGLVPAALREAQAAIGRADHLVLLFPLWAGTMPALTKGFLEQVMRPGFAFRFGETGRPPKKGLAGKSARLVVTMGMPAFVYRWFYLAHGVRGVNRSLLRFCGIRPVRATYIGAVDAGNFHGATWMGKMRALGRGAR